MNVQYFVHELPYTVVLLYLYVFYNLHLNSCVHSFYFIEVHYYHHVHAIINANH